MLPEEGTRGRLAYGAIVKAGSSGPSPTTAAVAPPLLIETIDNAEIYHKKDHPMRKFLAAISLLVLASCSQVQTSDTVLCGAGLMAARASNAAELIAATQVVPACRVLAIDAMQQIVVETMAKRGIK